MKQNDYRVPLAAAIASGDARKAEASTRDAMRAAVDLFAASVPRRANAATASPAPSEERSDRPRRAPARARTGG